MCFLASDLQYLSENVGIVVSCLEQQMGLGEPLGVLINNMARVTSKLMS
jgi:hypothetical protein